MTKPDEPIRPMTLGNMRQNGVRGLFVTRSACGYHTEINVDAWPDDISQLPAIVKPAAPSRDDQAGK